ncbi:MULTISPECIES: retron St85 family RNA-directed DNA polymerase [Flavobacteriaceae]|uniref:retron St85 family RNA-directed DNA polymerase n=1 Tax=Flavobacteriaceae TaxID=49546 RepID=UPI002349AE09|nr:retron St85 family RNA-directed DNA polymerase [Muricauda sp. SP22]MDC6362993.1 retron St85 family RNA-directed DNA polymerase [Muricauda sp. SP22]
MNWTKYSNKYLLEGLKRKIPESELLKNLTYAKFLFDQRLPIIYDGQHLSYLVGYKFEYLLRATKHTPYFYRHFSIPKKNKKNRYIAEPLPSLKEVQQWILKEILHNLKVSKYAKAYKKKNSLKTNAKFHVNQKYVLNFDFEDFFGTIKKERILNFFISIGYNFEVSDLLASLCTLNNKLPQGAPTSPYLSNLIAKDFDSEIGKYCSSNFIRYTRYSDDLTFSGNFSVGKLDSVVNKSSFKHQFKINAKKTRLTRKSESQRVTGLVVNKKMQAPVEVRKKFRQDVYYIKKFGLTSHLKKTNIRFGNYLEHLIGIGNHICFINPNDKKAKEELKILLEIKKQRMVNSGK